MRFFFLLLFLDRRRSDWLAGVGSAPPQAPSPAARTPVGRAAVEWPLWRCTVRAHRGRGAAARDVEGRLRLLRPHARVGVPAARQFGFFTRVRGGAPSARRATRAASSDGRRWTSSNPVAPTGRRIKLCWTEEAAAFLREAMAKFTPQNDRKFCGFRY
ncbi:uncharacterized protein LOC120671842 isoform X2 [Panicum virgatum]|uniref:uncharacterized protein LOC120671842 isoform X2 n=1 Tax=Panicum virgatum TaxID=38727 RepID=UPI0019D6AA9E|nr:uncharacterized protein LOC120671842 isoform X2 [Panicum virgatum]